MHSIKTCLIAILMTAACGEDGASYGTTALTAAQAEELCEAVCAQEESCEAGSGGAACVTSCADELGAFRGDLASVSLECQADLACGVSDDTCIPASCTPTAAHVSYETACRAKLTECGAGAEDVNTACEVDYTEPEAPGFACLFSTETLQQLDACFDLADCAAAEACFSDVFENLG